MLSLKNTHNYFISIQQMSETLQLAIMHKYNNVNIVKSNKLTNKLNNVLTIMLA